MTLLLMLVASSAAAIVLPVSPRPSAASPRPSASSPRPSHTALVLVTHGLEDVAEEYLVCEGLAVEPIGRLPLPRVALGEAAVGKLLVQVAPDAASLDRLRCAPVVQAVLAFVAAADDLSSSGSWAAAGERALVPQGVLDEVACLIGESRHWEEAIDLLALSGVHEVRSFRASCACSGRTHEGFGSDDTMRAMGGGVVTGGGALKRDCPDERPAQSRWAVDLDTYDVELFGTLCDGHFACGLLLGGEWRTNANARRRRYSTVPFTESVGRPYLENSTSLWYMPRLRPSTVKPPQGAWT